MLHSRLFFCLVYLTFTQDKQGNLFFSKRGGIFAVFSAIKYRGQNKRPLRSLKTEYYENIVERLLDDATAMLIHLDCKDGFIKMRLQIGCNEDIAEHTLSELSIPCGTFEWDIQDEDVTVTLLLSEGGDGK